MLARILTPFVVVGMWLAIKVMDLMDPEDYEMEPEEEDFAEPSVEEVDE